jgi:hypothetical protein
MPEPIDVKRIADQAITRYEIESGSASFAEALRLVWNARGAADILAGEHELSTRMGAIEAGFYCENLDRALRTLDRWRLGPTPRPCLVAFHTVYCQPSERVGSSSAPRAT